MKKVTELKSPADILTLTWPLLLYPFAYYPYKAWGFKPFAELVRVVVYGRQANPIWLAFNAKDTAVFFWLALSILVMLCCAVIAALRVRPWYFIPLYLLLAISLCGVLAFAFLNLTL